MRVLVDTNIVLDVLLKREPWVADAVRLWHFCEQKVIRGYISASSLTDIYYIARRQSDQSRARMALRLCLDTFDICPVEKSTLEMAYSLKGSDFEDNLQIACAILEGLDYIVSRNLADYSTSPVIAVSANEFLRRLSEN